MKKTGLFILGLIVGILFIIMGVWSLIYPVNAVEWLSFVFGALMIVSGIGDIVMYSRLSKEGAPGAVVSLVSGILCVITGILVLFNPLVGIFTLMALFPIWFMFRCISRLVTLSVMRPVLSNGRYTLGLVLNIIGIILSFLLMVSPAASLISMSWLVGLVMILIGINAIVESFRILRE